MTQLTPKAILVDVLEGATEFEFNEADNKVIMFLTDTHIDHVVVHQIKKNENWRILSLLSEMTEEKWREVVEDYLGAYKDYKHKALVYTTATSSGLSLLSSLGITDTKNKLVLVK